MASQSLRAWFAATMPKTKGSEMKDRKKSTVWTTCVARLSPYATTAPSSGASTPTRTSQAGVVYSSCFGNLFKVRVSVDAPTLAPQPPQRMGACLSISSASPPALVAAAKGTKSESFSLRSGSPCVYCHIHLRSIQSLRSQSQSDSIARRPRDATARPSPVPKRPRKDLWGQWASVLDPVASATRLLYSAMPAMTAKTPALGRA